MSGTPASNIGLTRQPSGRNLMTADPLAASPREA